MLSTSHKTISTFTILLFVFGWVSVNIYLPALPSLIHYFHSTPEALKLSITLFLAFFALAQLIWGPLSEKFGRKLPLVTGLFINLLGVAITIFAPNIIVFYIGRSIEAIGLAACPGLGRALLIDFLPTQYIRSTFAYATIAANVMPALAPIIGGNLNEWFGWRAIFVFLFIYTTCLLFTIIRKIPETLTLKRPDIKLKDVVNDYRSAFNNRQFSAYLILYVASSGALIAYYTITPFLFITQLHISSSTYAYYSLYTVASYIIGSFCSHILVKYFSINHSLLIAGSILIAAITLLLLSAILYPLSITSILIPMALYSFAVGIVSPNANAGALAANKHIAGVAAALLGFCMYAGSTLFSAIINILSLQSLLPIAIFFICLVGSAIILSAFLLKNKAATAQ